jgi:glutamyl-tRNA synthetase
MTVVTRFAPSPTGRLHVGNIRTALHNWLLAQKGGGRFLLRIDDTDAERSREDYVEAIRGDLAWLGLAPDAEKRQSERLGHYEAAFERLRDEGRVYPCYETSQELELKRKVLLGRGLPPIYERAALWLTDGEGEAKESQGIAPHWRFWL